jgi:hypothetical protein
MNLYTLKHFFIGMQRNNIKKKKKHQAALSIQGIYKKTTKKKKKKHLKKPKRQKKPPTQPQKPRALKEPRLLYTTTRALLPPTGLEPTPLASKLIEHSRFLTFLFPFCLGAEIEHYPSSTKVKKPRKPFSVPLKETPIM